MNRSGGKQFFSCLKCGECFYHKRLLRQHRCFENKIEGGDHWSRTDCKDGECMECGFCEKCRLKFEEPTEYQYHQEHCLLAGKTGYKHIRLLGQEKGDKFATSNGHPVLRGHEVDEEKEAEDVARTRILYADFESSIDPETGDHSFMSYGIYDYEGDQYECGYTLENFMNFVLDVAYSTESQDQIYVYFHNAMNYDANFILRYVLATPSCADWTIKTIMKSSNRMQKLVFYTQRGDKKRAIHIADTFLFMTMSLEKIVECMKGKDLASNVRFFPRFFSEFRKRYPGVSDNEIEHILRKNIFPYKFFTDSIKLQTGIWDFLKIFEAREENLRFFSERVTLQDLEKGYADTKHVIETFQCGHAKGYHDLYLLCDVMELADIFTRAMKSMWESRHIHLFKYLGTPSATWEAFLRFNPYMELPLYENTMQAEFFRAMLRGGVTSAALRHAKADETHSIIYLDVNGLYPYVMQKYLFPCGEFRFQTFEWDGHENCVRKLGQLFSRFEQSQTGMCFCVDLHFPDEVKRLTDSYPFAPEHRRIYEEYFVNQERELTPFLKKWSFVNRRVDDHGREQVETMKEFVGLVGTLYDKKKYNLHWRLLKYYIEHGVEVPHVYFGIGFGEGDYLAGYIRKNIEERNMAHDEFLKLFLKLLSNAVYGKTMEAVERRKSYEIIRQSNSGRVQGLLDESSLASITPIDELGWVVELNGEEIVLEKPTYIGACITEYAKLHMYELLYDKLMKIFPEGCEMVYTDTDSFILRVAHPPELADPHALFAYMREQDPNLLGGIGGQVKSETGEDDTIDEVIALRSKVYAYRTKKGKIGKRAKGTTHDAQDMQLDFEIYQKVLETLKSKETDNVQFVRKTFKIASKSMLKRSLSVNDGKRYIRKDGVRTHAFGYDLADSDSEDEDGVME